MPVLLSKNQLLGDFFILQGEIFQNSLCRLVLRHHSNIALIVV